MQGFFAILISILWVQTLHLMIPFLFRGLENEIATE